MVIAILCSVIKLCCSSLGVLFDEEQNGGRRIGGPMFYISKGLHSKVLATIYSTFLVGAAITVGNLVQVNSFVTSFGEDFQYKWVLMAMLAIPVAFILFGGLKRFAKFMSCIVPIMGVIYMIACVIGIFNLSSNFPGAIKQIILGAVGINSIVGGTFGFILSNAVSSGIRRGLFATDIGLGLAGIAHSNVDSHIDDSALHAKQQGIVALVAPIFVAGICAVTGTLIVCAEPNMALDGSKICTSTFNKAFGTEHAEIFVQTIVYCFALTTILAWAWFAEHSFYFVRKGRLCTLFKIALRSAQNQSLSDIEIVCLDDGSTDNSTEVIEKFQKDDPRIVLFKHERNMGTLTTRAYLCQYAKGIYIMWLVPDDAYCSPDAAEMAYEKV